LCLFFFSSRRRHTRSKRDWSSDVCSSDLSGKADLAIHSLDTLMGYFGQTNRLSFKYQTDDIVGFMWLGSMVQNQGAKEIMQKLQIGRASCRERDKMSSVVIDR